MGKRKMKLLSLLLAVAVTATTPAFSWLEVKADMVGKTELTDQDITDLTSKTTKARTSVHDPSIVKDQDSSDYYIFGSHMGVSKTSDLMNWTSVTGESLDSSLFGKIDNGEVVQASYNEAFLDSTNVTVFDDGKEYNMADWISGIDIDDDGNESAHTIAGNMWAPDIIYNTVMNKWCMYLSLNGSKWNSAVILLTADDIEGPYVYEGPVVFSGFSAEGSDKSYKKTDLEKVLGTLSDLPAKYNHISDGSWGEYLPHAIDPAVYYDNDGDLWMVYGSWSGGIYTLQLDESTGLRDYSVTYTDAGSGKNITCDQYFGTKLAGGNYVSGEGPYIEYIDGYYYLFVSYGFYSPTGGYNMRIFRSETPDGSYVDVDGESAIFTSGCNNYNGLEGNRGLKLIGNYKWDTMSVAEVAQGHNSVLTDDGRMYVIYHTKFADGTAAHEVRVHELFMNEEGWPVAAPYEYDSSITIDGANYAAEDVAGEYNVIVHDMQIDYGALAYKSPVSLTLEEDGTVTGEYTGTWEQGADSNAATLILGGTTYKGVFVEQVIEGTIKETMCFTIVNEDGLCVWGSKSVGDASEIALSVKNVAMPQVAFSDLTLPAAGLSGVTISWDSDAKDVISDTGVVSLPATDTTVNLTATFEKGDFFYNKVYPVKVYADPQNDVDSVLIASYFVGEKIDLSDKADGSLFVVNPYLKNVTPGINLSGGITLTFDIEGNNNINALGTILGFNGGGKLYFTPSSYLGYNATGGWFDANMKDYGLVQDYIGTEATVSICITPEGFTVLVDDVVAYTQEILETQNGGGDHSRSDYRDCLAWLNETAENLCFGSGSWWTDVAANCTISNVYCYANPTVTEDAATDTITLTKDSVELTSIGSIEYVDNPFYGETIEELNVKYTINLASNAAKNGWDGIFSFFNTASGGRVSFQTTPYICYNGGGSYFDINHTGTAGTTNKIVSCEKGQDYTFEIHITKSDLTMTMDGEPITYSVSGPGSYAALLSYVTKCDKVTWGVGWDPTANGGNGSGVTSFWGTELCTLSDIEIVASKIIIPVSSVTLDKSALTLVRGESEILTANTRPTYANNRAVEWESSDETVATVSSTGEVTGLKTGTATITATAKDGSGKSADCTVTVASPVTKVVLDASAATLLTGESKTLRATVTPSDADNTAVTWTSSNPSIATVSSTGKVEAIRAGSTVITATAQDGSTKSASCTITVINPTVTLNKSTLSLFTKATSTELRASGLKTGDSISGYKSSNTSVITVDKNGKLTATSKAGTATITVTTKYGATATCTVTVIKPTVSFNVKTMKLQVSKSTSTLAASGLQKGDSITGYKSSNTGVVTVNSKGKLTAKKKTGTATITVTTKYGATATCKVTVQKGTVATTSIKTDKSTYNVKVKKTAQIALTLNPINTTDKVTYKSSNPKVATVSATGKIKGVKKGTCKITITSGKKTKQVTVKVK